MASVSLTASGIQFSDYQTPSGGMVSELLDHYEEGTYTASIASTSYTFSLIATAGLYTKVGNAVSCNSYINWNGTSGSGTTSNAVTLIGFPFTVKTVSNIYMSVNFGQVYNIDTLGNDYIFGYMSGNTTSSGLFFAADNSTQVTVTAAELDNHSNVGLMPRVTYQAV